MINMTPAQIINAIKKEFPKLRKHAINKETNSYEYYILCGECKKKTKLSVAFSSTNGFCLCGVGTCFKKTEQRKSKFDFGGSVYYNTLENGDMEVFMSELRRVVPKMSRENDRFQF